MSDDGQGAPAPAVFTIPSHRSFADALVACLIAQHGKDPMALASGRILLPNNRAVRTVTDAFVRASGGGLVLPRLIPIGDPEVEERIGGALDPADDPDPIPPAVDPLSRLLALAELVGGPTAEAMRLAADLARTIDAMLIEEVPVAHLAEAAADAPDLAIHWQRSLEKLQVILAAWPQRLAALGKIDLAERRNRTLRRLAKRWSETPPAGFTVAAGITTAAPAVVALLRAIAFMPGGTLVLPGLSLAPVMPDEEWDALGEKEQTHPQFHLKLLLNRLKIARNEVETWRWGGKSASPAVRGRAVAHAMTAADFSDKWSSLKPAERRLTGVRSAETADPAAEALVVALALREAIDTPGVTAALVTPDRDLARRVSSLLKRWGIEADDSAGRPLSQSPAGTLLLALAEAAAEELAPVPLLALLKHPLVGGEGDERLSWLDRVRALDLALRGPRPAGGLKGLDRHFEEKDREKRCKGCHAAWQAIRPRLLPLAGLLDRPLGIDSFAGGLAEAAAPLAGNSGWRGTDGRAAAALIADLQATASSGLTLSRDDAVPLLVQLLDRQAVRPPYGGHPRVFIWGLLEARLQQADFLVLAGLNEGVWPAAPSPDPWLAPKIRANLGLPGLEYRVGLAAHDFASALGAPRVLVTRAGRDSRSPTVASRLWLRLQAMTGGLARDVRLERIAAAIDDPGPPQPVGRPRPSPPVEHRPKRISVTSVDRLKADPFAFYAQSILGLRQLEAIDADHTAAWKGSAVHEVLEKWLAEDDCDPDKLLDRAAALLSGETIHPMLRALWAPRLMEAIGWVASEERANRAQGRRPVAAERKGVAEVGGISLDGRADRIDRLADGGLAIIDYKTGKAPAQKAVDAGFALQLGLLGLIARAGGFGDIKGEPGAHEYWSLAKHGTAFGKRSCPDQDMGAADFLAHAEANFREAAEKWLLGTEPFTAKLNPAFAPYGDFDQLMRLEEWYGRE